MLLVRIFFVFNVLFLGVSSFAQVKLVHINHSMIGDNKYRVTLELDQQISYQVVPGEDKVTIDFTNTEFVVESISHRLDGRFLKAILKSNREANTLRMILELSENTKFEKSYAVVQDGRLFVTIEMSNNKIVVNKDKKNRARKKEERLKKTVIMIDPGHGGVDQGTKGSSLNILEKDLVLAYAKELYKELKKYPQYKVIMTRDSDAYLSSEERRAKARKMKADLFLSLHADFNEDTTLHGASVYTLSKEGLDKETANLSAKKAKGDVLKNSQLLNQNKKIANVLINMVYQDTQNASINLAKAIMMSLNKSSVETLKKSHRVAELKILKGVDTPAVLIEVGFLSNKEEEKLLGSTKHKKLFTQALVQGVNKYINNLK